MHKIVTCTLVTSLVPGSLCQGGRKLSIFYQVRDVKGRHNLITQQWTKQGAHRNSSMSIFTTTTVFLMGRYGFGVLPWSIQSAIYSFPCRTIVFCVFFLSQCRQLVQQRQ